MSDATKDDALSDDLPDADILKALAPYMARGGGGAASLVRIRDIERRQLVRGDVVRFTERRTETQRTAFGTEDLSALPLYEGAIADHPLPAPEGPGKLTLIRSASYRLVPCPCDGGTQQCASCSGCGRHPCSCRNEPPACDVCLDVAPCSQCETTGRRGGRTTKARPAAAGPRATAPGAQRITCAVCGTAEAACPRCSGRGRIRCPQCDGRGHESCARCSGRGVGTHEVCGGRGSLSHWVEGTVEYANEKASLSLPRPDWPDKVRDRLAGAARWQQLDIPPGGGVPAGVDHEHRAAVSEHLARGTVELSRRVTLETCPLARVELVDEPNRVFYVFPGARRLEVVPTLSNQLKRRLIAAGAVIVIIVVLILWLAS
ncbi:hypothetical protein GCM10011583_49350 [Streptomyces camponoticapitis]|uniref:Uncharacterized protein n=1 Tax=Streptomyces camponoticapitis TaxID=1616125 RepID=A0ABQ2EJZ5_9ACTN|nr:hypothetical protein [Streptomyces camponoticapitis]GGK11377.1 hypothetical protein GCM10011583_49350 [Streptomyces camponoticapitis]